MRMKFLNFDSVLPGLKHEHEHVIDFNGRDRLLSSWIINELKCTTVSSSFVSLFLSF